MILNLVIVMLAVGVLTSYIIERKCVLEMSDYDAPVWPFSFHAAMWAMEVGIMIRRFLYGMTNNTLMILTICGLALLIRLPVVIGCFVTMKELREKEE